MATKDLKVDELRVELTRRGLSTAGIKPTLVRRLEAAIREESEKLDDSRGCKRRRDCEVKDSDSEAPLKRKAIEELRSMTVKQLREEASIRGISAAGTKQELVERLSTFGNGNVNDDDNVEKENKEEIVNSNVPEKIKTADELQSMTIKQLREEAASRGISASGSKKELLERLSAADVKNEGDDDQVEEENKLKNVDSSVPEKDKTSDRLQRMNMKQLREEAAIRGLSTSGTKMELLDRLCNHNYNISSDSNPAKEEPKEEKIVTAMKKGSAVMDNHLPDHIKAQYHVLQVGDEIYDAMLNQTNLGQNNNKFFLIQVLESDDGGRFMVYFRWGRVGVKGQDKLNGPYTSQQAAISEFEKKFYDKTHNRWWNRRNFYSHPLKYTWLEMDYSEQRNEPLVQKEKEPTKTQPEESKLEPRIAKFISLICNMSMMRQQMMEIGWFCLFGVVFMHMHVCCNGK